jgi:hypothetical protein
MRNVGESLAGRMAVLELAPFYLDEVHDLERLWRCCDFHPATTSWRNPGWARVGKAS